MRRVRRRLGAVLPARVRVPRHTEVTDRPGVQAVAHRLGATPAQVGLAWLLAQADNTLLIPGTSSVAHLEQNLACDSIELSRDDLAELEQDGVTRS